MLEYTSKFMMLTCFVATFVADEKLKMNYLEVGLNPNINERIFVHQNTAYMGLYDTATNVDRVMKKRNNYFSE